MKFDEILNARTTDFSLRPEYARGADFSLRPGLHIDSTYSLLAGAARILTVTP